MKRYTPASWLASTSGLPVARDQALKSGTDPGSVARTSTSSPGARPFIALAVLTIGSGQAKPFRFRLIAIVTLMVSSPSGQPSLRDGVPVRLVEQQLGPVPQPARRRRDWRVVVIETDRRRLALARLEEAHDLGVVDVRGRSIATGLGHGLRRRDGRLVVRDRTALRDWDAGRGADRPGVAK